MSDPFVHLHVASGYSMRHGASHPAALVERAADHGMDALALTDRDGTYGAIRFAQACARAGIRPVLGVDLAVMPARHPALRPGDRAARDAAGEGAGASRSAPRTPVRGGAVVDPEHPRVTVLAQGRTGWAALCRLVSATHLAGERGAPVTTVEMVSHHAAGGGLVVLLGPGSEVGRALAVQRPDLARAHLARWRAALPSAHLVLEVVHHRGPGDATRAGRMLRLALDEGVPAVLTNQVRYVDRADAPVADVLDSARRLVPLDPRHIGRTNAEGGLKSGKEMALLAEEVARSAGAAPSAGPRLLAATRALAERCVLDPRADLGLGEVHFPELGVGGTAPDVVRDSRGVPLPGEADRVLRARAEAGLHRRGVVGGTHAQAMARLDEELGVISRLGYPAYFLTVADVVGLIKEMEVRCAARGSGAGSLVTYALGVSDVDPIRYGLLMERFLSPLRHALPDIDVDVESARRTEVYERVLERFGGERCACVSMMDTYRARHAIRDTGAALGMPPGEIDTVAKAFPHVRASQISAALRDLPELRASGLGEQRLSMLLGLAERLDGLPRHIALHPCGVLLSDATLLDRTPVESSWLGFPMSQFDKDDVETLGLLKLDLLGIRMQSAIAHAVGEVARVDGETVDIDAVPRDDPATFDLVQSTRTLGCFQIESPGQRELIGKFAPETFTDLIIDISLFRPGPVKSDMVRPFLEARQGWRTASYPHPDLEDALAETYGVVVFHEQVLKMVSVMAGVSLAEADEVRRGLGDKERIDELRRWFMPAALARGYPLTAVEDVWEVLRAFGSFGFCKAHAAAFALPTYQSAWLKAHHPAAFLAGVLTHDPGMYPKRLILDDARQFGIAVLGLDVNCSDDVYRVERLGVLDEPPPRILDSPPRSAPAPVPAPAIPLRRPGLRHGEPRELVLPDGRAYGIRLSLSEVKGITDAEVTRIVAGRPYATLADFWHRTGVSRPVVERLVVAGAFDSLYGIGAPAPVRRRGGVTRRDLLLQVIELDTWSRATRRAAAAASPRRSRAAQEPRGSGVGRPGRADAPDTAGAPDALHTVGAPDTADTRARARRHSQGALPVPPVAETAVQLSLDLGDDPSAVRPTGLPEMTGSERVRAELEVLGLDASAHVLAAYGPFLDALGVTRSRDVLRHRSRSDLLVAGVKVATQTPPIRSGRRVVFLTLDDSTGPVDATFFEDAQAGYAMTVFHSWLLLVRGSLRRTGPRGVSLLATGCWELPVLRQAWLTGGLDAVHALLDADPLDLGAGGRLSEGAVQGAAQSRAARPVMAAPPSRAVGSTGPGVPDPAEGLARGGRVLVHPATGYRQSAYADIKPAGEDARSAPRRLWHSSQGSSGG